MAIIKKKSMVVAFVSGFIICLVLALTLVGYIVYLEMGEEKSKAAYRDLMEKASAKFYAKYIEVARLGANIESTGALRGKPVLEGIIRNNGTRDITDILMRVKFLDPDGAIIYEVVFHPQEPALSSSGITHVAIPYLSDPSKVTIKPEGSLPFKKILMNCPKEILAELKKGAGFARGSGRWSGRFNSEILSINF